MDTTIAFAGGGLDRADHIRGDADKLGSLMNWRARLLRLEGIDPVISPDGGLTGARWPMPIRKPNWCSSASARKGAGALPK